MLELIWKSTVVLVAAGTASVLLCRASAAMRHLVWVLALASLLLLPLFKSMPPTWRAARVVNVPVVQVPIPSESAGAMAHRRTAPRDGLPVAAFIIWLAGAVVCLARWGRGAARVARMRRNAVALSDADATQEVARQAGLRGDIQLLRSPEEIIPLAAGIRHPYVLLPAGASQWSGDRLRVVLLHEHAHIRRRDSLTQALAELARCLYWFHPLVWLALRRLRVERERACDDLVLLAGTGASDYASHLLHLAQSLQSAEPSPAVSMAGAHLETRVRAILDPHLNRRVLSRASAVVACIVAACLVLPLAAMRPQTSNVGVVTGAVYDPAGARVPDASVTAVRTDNGQKLTTTTDQEGKFSIGPLAEGPWQLTIEARGFAERTIEGVDKNHYDITLDVGQMQETVVVRGKGSPAVAASGPQRVRVGGMVIPAKLLSKVDPEYSQDAQSRGIHGEVVLRAVISIQGMVLSLTSISAPDPALAEAAMKAVREWRYQPALLNGEPVETLTTITVNFELEP